ncbi:MAG: class I SAM-dependent methyltransferase [Anaerolineae bacterium]|nr:class I SAM-dependent methyltransferase [Anaerolineae bacterium]
MTVSTETRIQQRNAQLKAITERTQMDKSHIYTADKLSEEKIRYLADHCQHILDVGKSSREKFAYFKPGQAVTLDLNQYGDYPDIIDDLCDLQTIAPESFDGLVCLAVLEHVYDPQSAVKNMYSVLQKNGCCFAYVPFLYRYHAPADLAYQDYFRYTRDGVAYLFRDFSEVTLYPCRGGYSTILNLMGFWKHRVERTFGQSINKFLDRAGGLLNRNRESGLQASGYFIWAVK